MPLSSSCQSVCSHHTDLTTVDRNQGYRQGEDKHVLPLRYMKTTKCIFSNSCSCDTKWPEVCGHLIIAPLNCPRIHFYAVDCSAYNFSSRKLRLVQMGSSITTPVRTRRDSGRRGLPRLMLKNSSGAFKYLGMNWKERMGGVMSHKLLAV